MPQRHQPPETFPPSPPGLRARTATVVMTASGLLAGLYVLWVGRVVILLVFAGVLLAIFLRTAAAWVERRLRVGRRWSLAVVVVAIATLVALGIWLRGAAIADQLDQLQDRLPMAAKTFADQLKSQEWGRWLLAHSLGKDQAPRVMDLIPRVTGVLSSTLGFLAGIAVVVFLGVAIAAEPNSYRSGMERLFPSSIRPRVREIVEQVTRALRWWLVARLLSMCAVGLMVFVGLWFLKVPLAGTLGMIAALLTFIPNIGPFVSAIPPVLLAFTISPRQALLVIVLFGTVHAIEGFFVTPIAERSAVHLLPALTFSVQLLLAVVVGPIGIALAAPVTTVAMVLVRTMYVPEMRKR